MDGTGENYWFVEARGTSAVELGDRNADVTLRMRD